MGESRGRAAPEQAAAAPGTAQQAEEKMAEALGWRSGPVSQRVLSSSASSRRFLACDSASWPGATGRSSP
jgi:hypothetical protein